MPLAQEERAALRLGDPSERVVESEKLLVLRLASRRDLLEHLWVSLVLDTLAARRSPSSTCGTRYARW